MCYFLYGAINDGINSDDYDKVMKKSNYHFNLGNIKDVNKCVKKCEDEFRITFNYCDCKTSIGEKDINKKDLKELQNILLNLKDVRGIKYVILSKNWWKKTNKKEEIVHIDDIDILHFLANIEDNCVYKIELYKKYY